MMIFGALLMSLSLSAPPDAERDSVGPVVATETAGAGIGYLAGGIVGFLVVQAIAPRDDGRAVVAGPGRDQLATSVALVVGALVGIPAAAIGGSIAVGMRDRPTLATWVAVPASAVGGGVVGGLAGGIVSQVTHLSTPFY